jgi:tRNA (cmo5U34)-methyltransferase
VKERGINDDALKKAVERMKEDRPATLAEQLDWLEEAGFGEVTTWYQYYGFAVYSGMKAA